MAAAGAGGGRISGGRSLGDSRTATRAGWSARAWRLVSTSSRSAVVFVSIGPDSELFRSAFDTRVSGLLTITLVIAAIVVTSVLRTNDSAMRGISETRELSVDADGVLLRLPLVRRLAWNTVMWGERPA